MKQIIVVMGFLLASVSQFSWGDNTNTVEYRGTLVSLACVIDETNAVNVPLEPVVDKRLYLHGSSASTPFSITLKDCDSTISNGVTVTLMGSAGSVTAEGYLALDSSSTAQGVVIGIASEGKRVEVGKALPKMPVSNGTMQIPLTAYVQGTPLALANKGLVLGPFTATLHYQVSFE